MSFKGKLSLVLFTVLLAQAILALGTHDPERKSPIEKLRECSKSCESQQQQRRGEPLEVCQRRCQEAYEREKESYGDFGEILSEREEREPQQQQRKEENPYVFEDRHFVTGLQTRHGRVRILQKFTDRSKLLKGIENFRVSIVEADPQTFIVPSHWDAEVVLFVANGRGTVNLVRQEGRESFNIKQGDIYRIKAGTTSYLINRDNNEKLILVKLLQPINTPGHFEGFFGAGGENPESFFKAFSDEILEAAFNTRKDRLQKLFGQQKQGAIIKASQEQIRSMSHQQEEGSIWPFGGESKGTFNLYQQRPTHSNQYGQLYEVDSSHFRQLQDLDIAVSLANITQGAMTAPYYNSKATKISVVVEGEGYFEMACPHMSQQQQQQQGRRQREATSAGPSYQRISSRLKRGTVVVVPAGHPMVAVASNNQNLQLLCFEVNYRRRNVMKQLEREAKELAFGMPAREVEEVFNSQQEEFFFKGPRQQQQQKGRTDA
ncbi:vicilin-like antimicrobial peptides 2-2 [Phtheirospermum japonicum]|uniref:Vicilin-like antimicrobial peptides 2-2 n=1 Tax=Phtheirospermum japonicum TaxID=374723 RepID=A0A830BIS9_9LAMI|nr:vicilin-like antimicrobial peptides 2-2 [Phtheirospermum japonicum]